MARRITRCRECKELLPDYVDKVLCGACKERNADAKATLERKRISDSTLRNSLSFLVKQHGAIRVSDELVKLLTTN